MKMNKISKKNSQTDKDIKNIKFNNECEEKYFNQNCKKKYDTATDDDYLPIYNLVIHKKINPFFTNSKFIHYIDPISNQNSTTNNQGKNIVKLYVLNQKCDEVIDGQKKINNFLLRLKNVIKLCFLNTINFRNDNFIFDTNFRIDFDEKIIAKKFMTNFLINDTEAVYKIKNNLQNFFKDFEISDAKYYDFKPTIYCENYSFDSTVSLAFIDKQIHHDEIEFLNIENDITNAKKYYSPNFLRFFYTIKKNFNNEEIIYNAQFYYFENYYNVFRNWAAKIDLTKIDYNKLKLYFDGELKKDLGFCVKEIFDKINVTLLFGLVLNKKFRKNIIKGICYNFLIQKDLIIRSLVNKDSIFIYYEFENELESFEKAFLTCNTRVIRNLENDIYINLGSSDPNFESNKCESFQDENLSEDIFEKINHIKKFKRDHSILVEKIDKILFFILEDFEKYLLSHNFKYYLCNLTKSNFTENENIEFDSQIGNFKSEISKN
ncbi:hypothetical protein GVAV_002258 [Gurleya vavrai]